MKNLEKLMAKKKPEKEIEHKDVKLGMLAALKNEMGGMMKGDLDAHKSGLGVKKVEVAAPDKAGLADGLDQAKQMLPGMPDSDDEDSEDKDEGDKEPGSEMIQDMIEHEASEKELSPEEIDSLIQELQELKAKMNPMGK